MTIGVGDLLDLAISPEIGPVNFFHLRNLLHTLVEHFDIADIEAQQAEIKAPGGLVSSSDSSSEVSSSEEEESDDDEESESDAGEPEIQIIEEEVQKVVVDEDGNEKTVTVTVQKEVIKEPSEKKKDGESKKKQKDKSKGDTGKNKEKPEKKDGKKKKDKSKSEKDGDEKEGKKSSKKEKDKTVGGSVYGKDLYGKDSKKEKKLTADTIGDIPEIVNLTRRLDAVENGLKGLRNIVDSMVNQVDFGDGVGEILKAQLDQVQQQITTVELIPKEEPKEKKKKKKKGKNDDEEVHKTGTSTEGGAAVGGVAAGQSIVGAAGVVSSGLGAPTATGILPAVIPPPIQRAAGDAGKAGRMPSRKEGRNAGIPLKGATGNRPDKHDGEKPAPLKRRTTLRDLQIRKQAREEGVSIEEIEAREAEKESMDNKYEKNQKDPKNKKDDDADDTSSMESLDSEEEQAAMDEMIREEIEAALENAAEDPEAQAYALRLSLEQMNNMKKSITQSHDEFRKDMEKNKLAISQIARELALFRAARKAQDAEGFNAVHHVHSMVLELQTKHEKITATTTELVNEYNRREKTFEELVEKVERLQQNKADKQDVNHEINVKADKLDLEAKVSMNQFDEGFNLLDRGLSDALEKMETQMSVEDALKATLTELQSKLSLKLDRNELDNLKSQLESRIKDIQITKTVVREKPDDGEPAGFRRNITEKVHCISCDRPLEVNKGPANPNMPKIQGLPSHKSAKPYTTYELEAIRQHSKMNSTLRKAVINADLPYSAQKLRNEVVAMTGMVDLIDLPASQRYCGGSHTIMHPFRRSVKSTATHFNQYVMIRDDVETNVALPRRDFLVPKESQLKRYIKPKLPAIGQGNTREPSPPLGYDEGYQDRPSSAPATPGLYNNLTQRDRSITSPHGDITVPVSTPPRDHGGHSPVDVDRISVTLPSPVEET